MSEKPLGVMPYARALDELEQITWQVTGVDAVLSLMQESGSAAHPQGERLEHLFGLLANDLTAAVARIEQVYESLRLGEQS